MLQPAPPQMFSKPAFKGLRFIVRETSFAVSERVHVTCSILVHQLISTFSFVFRYFSFSLTEHEKLIIWDQFGPRMDLPEPLSK